ncbi:MAG: hypothetical protein GX351_02820 [Peptococcaceae bacterium]|jgi:hypothetical protein|nr:hypothetical protein [Peptococcaceae bacterium]
MQRQKQRKKQRQKHIQKLKLKLNIVIFVVFALLTLFTMACARPAVEPAVVTVKPGISDLEHSSENVLNVRAYAAGDGVTDDTAALQQLLDSAFAREQILFIDFNGGEYLISKPLLLPPGKRVTLQNGTLIATDNFPEDGFLIESGQAGKAGSFANEDICFDNMLFDSRHRGGGLKLESYNRAIITRTWFRHFQTTGLHLAGWSHEALVDKVYFNEYTWDEWTATQTPPERFGTALKVDSPDNHFSQVVVALAKKGIEVSGQYNQFANIHVWGCSEQGVHLKTSFLSFNQAYIDGVQVQIDDPWQVEIINSKFFAHLDDPDWSFIVLKPTKQNTYIKGLKIKDSSFHNTESTIKGLKIDNSVGSFHPTEIRDCFMLDNSFINVAPFASRARQALNQTNVQIWEADFASLFPFGSIQSVTYGFQNTAGNFANCQVQSITDQKVLIKTDRSVSGTLWVEADINRLD